ncbi:MAG TPA: class I SAM-dependent methyltransferase [Chthonomonadaceae bacterium]|nr:class I SAM-dependent methyltransferase [Chthonomonadaceae bacterium]
MLVRLILTLSYHIQRAMRLRKLPMHTDDNPARSAEAPAESFDRNQFQAIAPLYDTLMYGVPYDEWVQYLGKLLHERHATPRHILDLACGTGNVTERLAHLGYAMTGVDIAPGMIASARSKAKAQRLEIAYHIQDAAELDLPGQKFDLCISLFDSLNYITDPTRLALAMERVALHLSRGGLFIFDLNTEFALKNRFFDQDNLGSGEALRYDWKSEFFPDTRLCRVRMRFWYPQEDGTDRAFEEIHWQYAYRTDEILAMLQQAGFDDITTYQAYTFRAPGRASDRIFYIARKSADRN